MHEKFVDISKCQYSAQTVHSCVQANCYRSQIDVKSLIFFTIHSLNPNHEFSQVFGDHTNGYDLGQEMSDWISEYIKSEVCGPFRIIFHPSTHKQMRKTLGGMSGFQVGKPSFFLLQNRFIMMDFRKLTQLFRQQYEVR